MKLIGNVVRDENLCLATNPYEDVLTLLMDLVEREKIIIIKKTIIGGIITIDWCVKKRGRMANTKIK